MIAWYRQRGLLGTLFVYVLLTSLYSVIVPIAESPDELDHFRYIEYLVTYSSLPVMHPDPLENFTMEANQPPLFYWLNAAVTSFPGYDQPTELPQNACFTFDTSRTDRAHFYLHSPAEAFPYRSSVLAFQLARLLSVAIGFVTIVLTFELGRRLLPGDDRAGLLAAGLLAFNPQFIFINASVNNDVLTACLGAAVLLACLQAVENPQPKQWISLGVVMGLGLLTKYALLSLLPLVAVAVVVGVLRRAGWQRPFPWRHILIAGGLVCGLVIAIAGWWYGRSWLLYGDPLAWDVHLLAKGTQVLRTDPFRLTDVIEFGRIHFQSYWGWFGWLKIQLPTAVYIVLAVIVIGAAGGLILRMWEQRAYFWQPGQWLQVVKWPWFFSLAAVAAVYISLLRYILTINWSGYQGRLAFAAAAPIAALLAAGILRWIRSSAVLALPVMLALLSMAVLPLLAMAFPRPQLYQPAVDLPRVCANFEEGLLLEAFDAGTQVVPGTDLQVTLYGYGLKAGQSSSTQVQLVTDKGDLVVQSTATWKWLDGAVSSLPFTLRIPSDWPPSRLWLQVRLAGGEGGWQNSTSGNNRLLPEPLTLSAVKVRPMQPVNVEPELPLSAQFGDDLQLLGISLMPIDTQWQVTLYWQARRRMPQDWTTFVHILDAEGGLLSQQDSQPVDGRYPTSIWDVGEIVVDTKNIPSFPQETAVTIAVGVYDGQSLTRLPVIVEPGKQPQLDGLLRLPFFP